MVIASLAGPIAPLSPTPTTSTVAPSTMLSRMTLPTPSAPSVASSAAALLASAPATKSLLPQPTGVNPSTLAPQSSYDYTATALNAARVADSLKSASIFGRTAVVGGGASPSAQASIPQGGGESSNGSGPAANAMISNAPTGRAPDPVSASLLTPPVGGSPVGMAVGGGGGGGGGLPSMPSGDQASAPGSASSSTSGGLPTTAIAIGAVAVLGIGALLFMRKK